MALVALLGLAGVGLLAYALSGDGAEAAPMSSTLAGKAPLDKPEPIDASASAFDAIAAEQGELIPVPPPAVPTMPRALPEPTYEAGRMPAPTYPTLRDAARPHAPGTVPASSPYAEQGIASADSTVTPAAARSTTTFGDDAVPNGRTFNLQMSVPIQAIEGTSHADGFSVLIRGSLSLSRAGPIAAQHSSVERSMILNQGNDSVLTIRFVSGRRPAYRVIANGSTLQVILGQ
jgi:hypothetical protein